MKKKTLGELLMAKENRKEHLNKKAKEIRGCKVIRPKPRTKPLQIPVMNFDNVD